MRVVWRIALLWFVGVVMVFPAFIGSYTARIGWADHRSSRGVMLRDTAEILRQDRANYYRFGVRDAEDEGIGYFASRSHREQIAWMLRYGKIDGNLVEIILRETPLIRVDVYDDHLDVRRAERPSHHVRPSHANTRDDSRMPLRHVLVKDATRQLGNIARNNTLGFGNRDLKHRVAGVYFVRENNETIAWVVMASSPRTHFDCHACMPVLSVFVYRQERPMAWRPTRHILNVFQGGNGWDNMPDAEEMAPVHIAPDKMALAIRVGYANMGWVTESYTLVDLEGERARTLLHTTLNESNGGTIGHPMTRWESTIRIRPAHGGHYDVFLRRKGTLSGEPIDYTVRYRYDGTRYVPEGEDRVLH